MFTDGIYSDISQRDYRRGSGISKSVLDKIRKSPAHAKAYLEGASEASTPAQVLGSAFHTLVLEPHKFDREYIVSRTFDRRTKQGKEDAARFELENVGRVVIDEDDHENLLAMQRAVMADDCARNLLQMQGARAEHSMYWTDPETGQQLRSRPDLWGPQDAVIVDVKTTEDASEEGFARSIADYRYHVQAAYYSDIAERLTGRKHVFAFLAVEKKAPFNVSVYTLKELAIEQGRREYYQDLWTLMMCEMHNRWPGYTGVVTQREVVQSRALPIDLPAYYYRKHGVEVGAGA